YLKTKNQAGATSGDVGVETFASPAKSIDAHGVVILTGSADATSGAISLRVHVVDKAPPSVPIDSFFLPRTLTLTVKSPSSAKDTLVGSGYIDDGGGVGVNYASGLAKIDIGGWTRSIPLTPNKRATKFTFK